MKTIIRQTTFLVMVLLAAVCHGAKTNRYDYSRLKYLTAENIAELEHMRTTWYKRANTDEDTNIVERCVWIRAMQYDACNRGFNNTFIKDLEVVELPKPKPKRKRKSK